MLRVMGLRTVCFKDAREMENKRRWSSLGAAITRVGEWRHSPEMVQGR
jgi:hypothetical protein